MISRRDFLQMLATAAGASALHGGISSAEAAADAMYDPARFGNLSLMHMGDSHGQLLPHYYRETSRRMGVGANLNQPGYLVGEHLLERFRILPSSLRAHALTHLHFEEAALVYGKVGGMAELASVVERLRVGRRNSLLLDSGDTWQGSGLSLWTRGKDMAEMSRLLGVDAMTGDWEFALGAARLKEILEVDLGGRLPFLAHNVDVTGGGAAPFQPYSIFFVGGVPVGVIGQAYPHIGRFGARDFIPEWQFGIDEERLQETVDHVKARGARVVVLLSHAGLPCDSKLARRVHGIDVIFSGHTHDALPEPLVVRGASNQTLIVSSGSDGKFLGLLDLDVRDGKVQGYRYHLLPIFANLIKPDAHVAAAIERLRRPHAERLDEELAVTESMLYRRDSFKGTFDQLVLDILRQTAQADVALGPGYRWGPSVLPGQAITLGHVVDHLAIAQAGYFEEELPGAEILRRLEDRCDEVFNPDPYLQSGEDMARSSGLNFRCDPAAQRGQRIRGAVVGRTPLDEKRLYKVVSWGVWSPAKPSSVPVWQVVAAYLRRTKTITKIAAEAPGIVGARGNLGVY